MSKKIIDLGFGVPNDANLGFIGDPSSGALSKATYATLKTYFQSGSSLLLTGSYVTTASFNAFSSSYVSDSSSNYTVVHNLQLSGSTYVLTSTYLLFSASYHNDSSSFDARIAAISSSMITGSFVTTFNFNVFSGSVASNFSSSNSQINNTFFSQSNYLQTSSFNSFSSSYHADSGSGSTKVNNIFASQSGYVLTSSYLPFSSSYNADSSSFYTNILNTYLSESNYVHTSSINGNNSYIAVYSSSQGFTFGQIYQSGSSIIIGGVTGILPGVGLQVNGPIFQNDNTGTIIGSGTTLQRPSGSQVRFGMMRFNTDSVSFEGYNGVSWLNLQGSGSSFSGSGSVTSVGLSLPSLFNVGGTPVVGAGVLSGSFNSFSASLFLASPSSSTGVPSMRALSIIDIAPLTSSFIGNFVTTSSFNAFSSSHVADSSSFNIRINNVFLSESNYTPLSIFNPLSSSYSVDSSSFLNLIINSYASESNYLPTSSFNAFTSSYLNTSASINTQLINSFASESNYLTTSSIVGSNKFIPVFTGVNTLSNSIMYQSGSGTGSAILINGNTTGSNNAVFQVSGGLSVSGPIYDSTNSTGSSTQILSSIPGGLLWTSTGSGFWSLSGNSISSGSFIGTTNAQDLILKRNNNQMGLFTANNSIVLGNSNNTVSGSNSIVLGGSTNMANTMAAVIAGGSSIALGNSSVVLGGQTNISIGVGTVVLGGSNLSASAFGSIVLGRFNDPISSSNSSAWIGGDPLFIIGNGSTTSSLLNALVVYKTGSLAIPFYTNTIGSVLGIDNNGYMNNIPFYPSASINADSSSFNNRISTLLNTSSYNGQISGSNGSFSIFSGSHSLTNGNLIQSGSLTIFSGSLSQSGSNIFGLQSVAFGFSNTSVGLYSFVHGFFNTVSGIYCHAEGSNSGAQGTASHAEGQSSVAIGDYSHAEGIFTQAIGTGSHAQGFNTVASAAFQAAMGRYNNTASNALVIIGNGLNTASRSDLALFNTGSIQFNADLILTGSLHLSQSILDSTGASGLSGQVLSSTGTSGTLWINGSGSSLVGGFLTTSSFNTYTASTAILINNVFLSESNYTLNTIFNTFSSSYSIDSGSFNTRINAISSSGGSNLTGSYVTTGSFNVYTGSVNTQILNVFASESNYHTTASYSSSISGKINLIPVFNGTNSLTGSVVYQSGSSIILGNTTGSNASLLQIYGDIYISRSLYDSTNTSGSTNQVLTKTPSGVKWVNSGSGGTTPLNFIVGDGQSFTPVSGSTQFSSSGNPLVGRTVLQFFMEGALLAPISRSVAWYSFTGSNGIINLNNATFDVDTFYSILYT